MAESKGKDSQETTRGTAPSAPDLDKLERFEAHPDPNQQSDVDAMGQDKRRAVVGHSYGPSRKSQVLFFIAVAAFLLIVIGGSFAAIAAFDQPPDEYPDEAPWSEADATQIPTRDPSGPCGERDRAYPQPADSPCVDGSNSENEPANKATSDTGEAEAQGPEPGQEKGSGGIPGGGGEAE